MKLLIPILALSTFAIAQEPETIPLEKAQEVARKITAGFGAPADAPLAVEVDTAKVSGLKAGKAGLIVIADKNLTKETLEKAGAEAKGIGQLWMNKIVPAVAGSAADPAKLRSVEFPDGDEKRNVQVYFLGVTKGDDGALSLALYAKDKEPLVKVPLAKTDAAASSEPITLSGHKEDDETGMLVVSVFGSYKADIAVKKPRE
jgi:hypothetical protein